MTHFAENGLPDPEVIGADHGHWAAFDNTGRGDFVCECGLPWTAGEGCAFVRGARALAAATRIIPPGKSRDDVAGLAGSTDRVNP